MFAGTSCNSRDGRVWVLCWLQLVVMDGYVGGLALLRRVWTRLAFLVAVFSCVCVFYFTISKKKIDFAKLQFCLKIF